MCVVDDPEADEEIAEMSVVSGVIAERVWQRPLTPHWGIKHMDPETLISSLTGTMRGSWELRGRVTGGGRVGRVCVRKEAVRDG